jgi:hypothetical protein
MLSTASVLQHFIGNNKVKIGACSTLGTGHKFDEIYTNAVQL